MTTGTAYLSPSTRVTPATLTLSFSTPEAAARYASNLASLVASQDQAAEVVSKRGIRRDDLTALELVERIERGLIRSMTARLGAEPSNSLRVDLSAELESEIRLHHTVSDANAKELLWLQCDAASPSALPVLAVPSARGVASIEALHAWVALAASGSGFVAAEASLDHGDGRLSWSATRRCETDRPIVSSAGVPVHWIAATESTPDDERRAVAWFAGPARDAERGEPDQGWRSRFNELLTAAVTPWDELTVHLQGLFDVPFAWSLTPIEGVSGFRDAVAPEAGVVSRVIPLADRVLVAVDGTLEPALLGQVLAHACAHCVAGHVRPGDAWSHWDTLESATSSAPRRHWDRVASSIVEAVAPFEPKRRVTRLDDCTPEEKAWLILHDHVERMVGEARALHPVAAGYQPTEYQRQAAQRLVSQLDEFDGAMLCDGVGLGKTYVATTVIVHYVNVWRDVNATSPAPVDDAYRITVLAPNSVVSTWLREAIAPLAKFGVPVASVRVLSHSKFSSITLQSEILASSGGRPSDLEHLLMSDLVVVDESHAFRSGGARRTRVLRELLRLQPRRDVRRKVLLATATPVNNGLEDLRQQASLLFSTPLWLGPEADAVKYRAGAPREITRRIDVARSRADRDVIAALVGWGDAPQSATAIEFRDDLDFGVRVRRIGDYLREEEKRLDAVRRSVRERIEAGESADDLEIRVASELLDRIVVQRSRELCKRIERERGSDVELLFRADSGPPEALVYEDVYDDTRDVLARFLPLFGGMEPDGEASRPLSLAVYAWTRTRTGDPSTASVSPLVGLQRILILKRLESSPVVFLITVLRLLALHARRLRQLTDLAERVGEAEFARELMERVGRVVGRCSEDELSRLDSLVTGDAYGAAQGEHLRRWSDAHDESRSAIGQEEPAAITIGLYDSASDLESADRDAFDRLRGLGDDLLSDFTALLGVAPSLAETVFGRFDRASWPKRLVASGGAIDWPRSAVWGLRIVTDLKLRRLVVRLLRARRAGQKAIVFSQFTDTLAYVDSAFRAMGRFDRGEWRMVLAALVSDLGESVDQEDVRALVASTAVITGDTEDRDDAIDAFAPFYRLGPARPEAGSPAALMGDDAWERGWIRAMERPVDVLLSSDVLAEGVNLQDAALMINFDVHWNPVKMIQRTGRIDRRLDPEIETAAGFPDLEALAERIGCTPPRYWWAGRAAEAPITVNLLPPRELEAALQVRERIAHKTLAIDFTMGLERGTGAEADWMSNYRYQGISALNAWQADRAVERVAGYRVRLQRVLAVVGIDPSWGTGWAVWVQERGAGDEADVVAWGHFGRRGGEIEQYSRHLVPLVADGAPHWLWTTAKPQDSALNFWLRLDGATAPPSNERSDLPWCPTASQPLSADVLLAAIVRVLEDRVPLEERGREVGRLLRQGLPAIAAGFFDAPADRVPGALEVKGIRVLQLGLPKAGAP